MSFIMVSLSPFIGFTIIAKYSHYLQKQFFFSNQLMLFENLPAENLLVIEKLHFACNPLELSSHFIRFCLLIN